MTDVHVLRLVGEVAGERSECYRWTFDGPTTSDAAIAFAGEAVGNDALKAALKSESARWRLECSCRWASDWRSAPKLLWTLGLFHQLATSL